MTKLLRDQTLVQVNSGSNNNKFYRVTLAVDGTLTKRWGRVGAVGQTKVEQGNEYAFESAIRAKLSRGYSAVEAVADTAPSARGNVGLASAARQGLVSDAAARDTVLDALIDRLVAVNAHSIVEQSGGLITVDTSGVVKTALGIVSTRSLAEAAVLLDEMEPLTATARGPLLDRYLRLVPQKVPARAGWAERFFDGDRAFQKQRAFLDQLRESVDWAARARSVQASDGASSEPQADIFRMKIAALAPTDRDFKRVAKLFEATKNRQHAASARKVVRVYKITDRADAAKAYRAARTKLGNERELWHGTRAMNVLSVLAKGYYVPPTSGTTVVTNGRMFGDGVYFSEQSSKSLGYVDGEMYARGAGRGASKFLLLNGVVMGASYRPRIGWDVGEHRTARNGSYDSTDVAGGSAGVRNHEAIVWNTEQIQPRFLVEVE
ncbi:WGR domain-containing protein [Rathayibacter rathayi]|uniref:NAD(+) ADP-ribosyltransferase n=1 Tax=Rathayibacter rathayi TaxID=33887 RepID=A0ABX5AEN0_RATRA|nr:WGR domain-containing protein [Rathayibacter rathayi]PPF24272.1 hypothetical protein C5C34_05945 [Rathayibacter rathayi]PPF51593.1 hypothetical protein C5C08_01935 [Rathayibacter rathayi]PPF83184.1 hypothetical protein C5C14_01975 [Rathayibacter rathayi]PPG47014.1 hypothetical protein C5C20_01930 [Rathayibacter rathayi]PPG96525.1 hypothetical protein C5C22_02595 [Rathayibacter rathayi]